MIFSKENSSKANIIYDINECDINGIYEEDKTLTEQNNENKRNSSTDSNDYCIIDKQRSSSENNHRKQSVQSSKNNSLVFVVEIDHPYLEKCKFKKEFIFETLEFYNKLKEIISKSESSLKL